MLVWAECPSSMILSTQQQPLILRSLLGARLCITALYILAPILTATPEVHVFFFFNIHFTEGQTEAEKGELAHPSSPGVMNGGVGILFRSLWVKRGS